MLRITVIIAAGTTAAMAALTAAVRAARVRVTDRREDSSSQEEAADKMADLRATDKPDFREAAGRVLQGLQVIVAVRGAVRVLTAVSAVVRVTAEALEDREADSEIISQVKALQEKLLPRIWRRSARKKSGVQTARRKENAPGRTISTRRMMQQGRNPADSLNLRRRKKKQSKKLLR